MEAQQKKLVWRCRRGTRELDELLCRYLQSGHPDWSGLERLLEQPDPLLSAWLLGSGEPEDRALKRLVDEIRTTPVY